MKANNKKQGCKIGKNYKICKKFAINRDQDT